MWEGLWERGLEVRVFSYGVRFLFPSTDRALIGSGPAPSHEHDGCPTTIVETNHSFEDSRAVGQGREVRAELDSAVVPDD